MSVSRCWLKYQLVGGGWGGAPTCLCLHPPPPHLPPPPPARLKQATDGVRRFFRLFGARPACRGGGRAPAPHPPPPPPGSTADRAGLPPPPPFPFACFCNQFSAAPAWTQAATAGRSAQTRRALSRSRRRFWILQLLSDPDGREWEGPQGDVFYMTM